MPLIWIFYKFIQTNKVCRSGFVDFKLNFSVVRPNRSADDAVRKAKGYMKEGYKVNQDRLMATLAKKIFGS